MPEPFPFEKFDAVLPKAHVGGELYIVATAAEAHHLGFQGGRHPHLPNALIWWPALGFPERLMGRELARVYVGPFVEPRTEMERAALMRTLEVARAYLRIEPMLWMEF